MTGYTAERCDPDRETEMPDLDIEHIEHQALMPEGQRRGLTFLNEARPDLARLEFAGVRLRAAGRS